MVCLIPLVISKAAILNTTKQIKYCGLQYHTFNFRSLPPYPYRLQQRFLLLRTSPAVAIILELLALKFRNGNHSLFLIGAGSDSQSIVQENGYGPSAKLAILEIS